MYTNFYSVDILFYYFNYRESSFSIISTSRFLFLHFWEVLGAGAHDELKYHSTHSSCIRVNACSEEQTSCII